MSTPPNGNRQTEASIPSQRGSVPSDGRRRPESPLKDLAPANLRTSQWQGTNNGQVTKATTINQQLPSPSPSNSDVHSDDDLGFGVLGNGNEVERQRLRGPQNRMYEAALERNAAGGTTTSPNDAHVNGQGSGLQHLRHGDLNSKTEGKKRVRKLSSAKIQELTTSPQSLPLYTPSEVLSDTSISNADVADSSLKRSPRVSSARAQDTLDEEGNIEAERESIKSSDEQENGPKGSADGQKKLLVSRPALASHTYSTPDLKQRRSSNPNGSARSPAIQSSKLSRSTPKHLVFDKTATGSKEDTLNGTVPSPMPPSIPAPPPSLPTYLQLELSSNNPSSLYIHRPVMADYPYESSHVKLERLLNFLLLPLQLEQVLWFGALACLDAWLYTFTILPLRFAKALSILARSWGANATKEINFIGNFIYAGVGRMWHRNRRKHSAKNIRSTDKVGSTQNKSLKNKSILSHSERDYGGESDPRSQHDRKRRTSNAYRHHRRTVSTPSALQPDHKADILRGLLILISCIILMHFDASRMYHGIRGQAAIKLYVIYNVLEVCDRLFSAIGQDVLECLFSQEALERKPNGRSKVRRPFLLFILALLYNVIHATALFYQVITLNVAVNSYSNALLTLLMSNQFVEIKSTVFKKFEKENLFQLTCADVVERFQLWLMLTIIAARNIIETGGLSLSSADAPVRSPSILPKSFTLFPPWTGQVMVPFLLVLGSEMLVDWIKHAYITKFNLTKPAIYGRFLDVLAKDYYSNAFVDQNLTRRLGLPVIPLSCLFIRASVQTYHMFLATHMPLPVPSTATSLSVEEATSSPATTAALQHIDHVFRRALGRSTFGGGSSPPSRSSYFNISPYLTTDDLIAFGTMMLFFLVVFLLLLALKLVLGMLLLSFARRRYKSMKGQEQANNFHAEGKRVGGWGVVEVDEDKRRWIYADDPEGVWRLRQKEREMGRAKEKGGDGSMFGSVDRYSMVAKRIW